MIGLREWLLDRIDGGEEMRGEDGLVSDFIRQIDAATTEIADLKQRLLPQFQGRAQRAERDRDAAQVAAVAAERDARHERDAMLEQLIAARSATAAPVAWMWDQATYVEDDVRGRDWHPVMGKYKPTDHWMVRNVAPLYAAPVEETAPVDHSYIRSASLAEGRYVCACGACMKDMAPVAKESE